MVAGSLNPILSSDFGVDFTAILLVDQRRQAGTGGERSCAVHLWRRPTDARAGPSPTKLFLMEAGDPLISL